MSSRLSMMKFAAAAGLALSLLVAPSAFALDEQNVSKGGTLAGPGLAVHGYDVVSFFGGQPVVGSDQFAIAHNGAAYRFATQANLDAFKASPAKYEPAYGGYCAYGVVLGKKLDGDPRFSKIVDGKLFLNLNGDIQTKWAEDIAGNVKKADDIWNKIQATAAGKL